MYRLKRLLTVAALTCGDVAVAQSIVDGSGGPIDQTTIRRMMTAVTKDAVDPLSAQFRGLALVEGQPKKWPKVICGYINLKNGFGGYVGFRPFYYDVNRDRGGIWQRMKKSDLSYKLARMPLEWSGCDITLNVTD